MQNRNSRVRVANNSQRLRWHCDCIVKDYSDTVSAHSTVCQHQLRVVNDYPDTVSAQSTQIFRLSSRNRKISQNCSILFIRDTEREQFRKQTYSLTSRYYAVPITQCCPNFSALSQWLSAVPWFSALLMTRRCPNYSALSQWLSTVPITQCCPNDSALSPLLSNVKMTPCFPIDSVLNRQHLALTRTTMSKDKCKYLCQFAKNCKIG